MSSRKIDTWIWGLIYAGMALGALGPKEKVPP